MKRRRIRGGKAGGNGESSGMLIVQHPRSPDATLESLRALSGIIRLTGPVPPWKFLEEEQSEPASTRDGDRAFVRRPVTRPTLLSF